MRRALTVGCTSAALIAAPLAVVTSQAGSSAAVRAAKSSAPSNPSIKTAGPQHFCGTNGILCTEPARTWDEMRGYDYAIKHGAHISPYIGHDEPATLFYSHQP